MSGNGERTPDESFLYADQRSADELTHDLEFMMDLRELADKYAASRASESYADHDPRWQVAYDSVRTGEYKKALGHLGLTGQGESQ